MKYWKSILIALIAGVGSVALKAKGYGKLAILTLVIGALGGTFATYFLSSAAELERIPVNFTAGDSGFLNSSVTAAATSMTISPITKWPNGVKTEGCFDSGSGFVLLIDGAGRKEYASYGSKSCSSNITTLSEMRRGLDPTSTSFTAGTGLSFAAGTSIRVINWPGLYNHALYNINHNVLTASGRISVETTTQPGFNVGSFTTAQRDAFTLVKDGDVIYNSTVGSFQLRVGSAWINSGSGTTINATTSVAGKSELAGTGDTILGTGAGDSGAQTVLTAVITTMTGGLTSDVGKVPILNESGVLEVSAGGTGLASLTLSGVLIGNGTAAASTLVATAQNQVIKADSNNSWVVGTVPSPTIGITVADQGKLGDSTTAVETGTIITLNAGQFNSANDTIHVTITGEYRNTGGNNTIELFLGTTKIASLVSPAALNTAGAQSFVIHAYLQSTVVGASGTVKTEANLLTDQWIGATSKSSDSDTIDTTASLALKLTSQFSTSNASNYLQPFTYQVDFIDQ